VLGDHQVIIKKIVVGRLSEILACPSNHADGGYDGYAAGYLHHKRWSRL
jgi:hypothetical protein